MSALSPRHVWSYRAILVVISLSIITLLLLPLNLLGGGVPAPDFLVAVTFAWLMRQPAVVPLGMVFVIFLLADFLLQRPPGLWTLLVILASESLRRRRLTMAEFPFFVEWTAFSAAMIGIVLLNQVFLWVLLVDAAPLGLSLAQGILTIIIYPIVVAVSKYIFRLRKLGPAELEPF